MDKEQIEGDRIFVIRQLLAQEVRLK